MIIETEFVPQFKKWRYEWSSRLFRNLYTCQKEAIAACQVIDKSFDSK